MPVKELVSFDLDVTVPDRIRGILAAVPRLRVRTAAPTQLHAAGGTGPVLILGGRGLSGLALAPGLADLGYGDHLRLVVAERLPSAVRADLEAAGASYVDASGSVHLEAPGLLLHIEPGSVAKTGAVPPPKGLGVVAVRLIQHLLVEPDVEWTVTELAQVGGASLGQAHNVLRRLDREGFITEQRAGKEVRRRVTSRSDLLDWLARIPAARRSAHRLRTYLYAPEAAGLVTRLTYQAHQTDVTWALTGTAAARVYGLTTVTALPVITVRIGPQQGLEDAADRLHLQRVDSGHNVLLLADTGEVGTHGTSRNGPVVLAPTVRIWLDILGEPRGEDAAALFREAVLGY
jgi:hypothetical protein